MVSGKQLSGSMALPQMKQSNFNSDAKNVNAMMRRKIQTNALTMGSSHSEVVIVTKGLLVSESSHFEHICA